MCVDTQSNNAVPEKQLLQRLARLTGACMFYAAFGGRGARVLRQTGDPITIYRYRNVHVVARLCWSFCLFLFIVIRA